MSRRSKGVDDNPYRNMQVLCTRRGTHPAKRIGKIQIPRNLGLGENPVIFERLLVEPHFSEDRLQESITNLAHDINVYRTYPLTCSKCGFNAPVRGDRLDTVVRALAANDVMKLDISYLPDMLTDQ